MSRRETAVRAPGKVLILGGYCILERPNEGVVLAVTSSFKTVARWVEEDDDDAAAAPGGLRVRVTSRQWGNWRGSYVFTRENGLVPDAESAERNAYVEKPLAWALYAALSPADTRVPEKSALVIELLADNDFYSQQENLAERGLPRTVDGLRKLPPNCDVKNKSAKTGLGSSAAMITSIVVCVLKHITEQPDLEFCHRVAQLAHAAVQGKIGSGFDVCAALNGSMRYIRYDPAPLEQCLSTLASSTASFEIGAKSLVDCANDSAKWNHVVEPVVTPTGIELLCADVAGGSETPSMSRKILDWKAKSDGTVWNSLIARNDRARTLLSKLRDLEVASPKEFASVLSSLSKVVSKDWKGEDPITKAFIECRAAFLDVRDSLQTLGSLSGVPVEPLEQTALCDDSLNQVPGVLACGVPGAGGFDAVFALVLGPDAERALEKYWEQYKNPHGEAKVCALLLRESRRRGCIFESDESNPSDSKKPRPAE